MTFLSPPLQGFDPGTWFALRGTSLERWSLSLASILKALTLVFGALLLQRFIIRICFFAAIRA